MFCKGCATHFKLLTDYNQHFCRVVGLICHQCFKTFQAWPRLSKHLLSCGKGHQCQKCLRQFSSETSLLNHTNAVHRTLLPQQKQYICGKCKKSYSVQSQYNTHILQCGTKNFKCNICQRVFVSHTGVNIHMYKVHKCYKCHNGYYENIQELEFHKALCDVKLARKSHKQ